MGSTGLMWSDPGIVRRTNDACFPLPPEVCPRGCTESYVLRLADWCASLFAPAQVEEKLRKGEPLDSLRNIVSGGRAYCVRCCVWRMEPEVSGTSRFAGVSSTHHCTTCQRCVVDFDHHCGVFGRCIAGSGLRGNMKYFKCILTTAVAGILTTVLAFVMQAAA
uniref:Palmitoyltransferase n=1 Tax=Haptolina ericina TaxID=156174 RepID=A0A7S3B2N1_9EUKA|mmetsp:Transcript_44820/g.101215  ORF Transcript_44820/g.101215 Transcript_44820/m.101215 type:complete len:163 (+) Transcript_44820:510-998(+)